MHRIRVAVLRGGPSNEYDISLNTGANVLKNLPDDIYEPQDIFISKSGIWHKNGSPIKINDALSHADVVWNALHGCYGEDGKLAHILEIHRIPFTGSGSFASAIGMNKLLTKNIFRKNNIKTPQHKTIEDKNKVSEYLLKELFQSFTLPFIVKAVSSGSSVGVYIVKNFHSFENAVNDAFLHSDSVMIEEYISGREATVGVIDKYRNHEIFALPPIEIRPLKSPFFDYNAKYISGMSEEIVPSNFPNEIKSKLENLAKEIHILLGLRHYSRIDFIVNPKRGIFALEANTLPGLMESSLLPKALYAVGATMPEFLHHVLQLALERK